MAMTVPSVPSIPAGVIATSAQMNQLSACCTFILGKPVARVVATTGSRAIATTATAIQFDSASFDPDGMWNVSNPTQLTIQTPGWYKVRYSVVAANTVIFNTYVTSTTGTNNPAGSGITSAKHLPGYGNGGGAGLSGVAGGASGMWPFYLYALDFLTVGAMASSAGVTSVSPFGSSFALEYVSI
jgi:hypothetical protein